MIVQMRVGAVQLAMRTRVSWLIDLAHQKSRRFRRLSRLARRAREAPPRFLVHKLFLAAQRPLWVGAYCLNATRIGHRILHDLTPRPRQRFSGLQLHREWQQLASHLAESHPDYMEELVAKADRALEHRIPCLGFGEIDLGASIDWHRDYVANASWPRIASLRIDFVREDEESDVKVPWEINRLQWLVWLGQAWSLTNDSRYLTEFTDTLKNWWRDNPVGIGVAWTCPMEAAIRGINLIAAFELFWPALDQKFQAFGQHMLSTHASFLRRHPELSDVNGNHYLADLAGIVQLGQALTTADARPRWLDGAIEQFEREVDLQFHDDGVHHEHATGYHRLVTELVLGTVAYLQASGCAISRMLEARAQAMLDFLANIVGPDGAIPLIGDSDSGQVLIFGDEHPNDVNPLLALGALLFARSDLWRGDSSVPGGALWHLGPRGIELWKNQGRQRLQCQSRLFPVGGYATLRAAESVVVTRFGSAGLRGRAAHDHDDLTSFTAQLLGIPVIIDTGSSTYTGSRARRRAEISPAAHNRFIVGGRSSANLEMGSVMDVVRAMGTAEVLEFDPSPDCPAISMSHDAFNSIGGIQDYSRTIVLIDQGTALTCIDRVNGKGIHKIQATFHLAPIWDEVSGTDHRLRLLSEEGEELRIDISELLDVQVDRVMTAPLYGYREQSLRLRLSANLPLPICVSTHFELGPSRPATGAKSQTGRMREWL